MFLLLKWTICTYILISTGIGLSVGGVCNFLSSVSSQQKFEAMDQHYSPQTNCVTALGQISVTALCNNSVLFRKWRKMHHRGMRLCLPQRHEKETDHRPFGSSFCIFPPPLGLLCVNWASRECRSFYSRSSLQSSDLLFSGSFPILVF